ncbi:hypothetical protein [Pseudidiomarina donghaiensis]|uniref:Uncharacterized protein n=1 Tax=Pseudidiomarina donghaiensis TaxID=519452 RepID=A0A432XLH4_9GAMM|nr:hypothetical protein [Pseudidiomarina donghaiensis]RUO49538.1 hypothetical protein CWE24_03310 [Pseudidiomarina donghaiensis]
MLRWLVVASICLLASFSGQAMGAGNSSSAGLAKYRLYTPAIWHAVNTLPQQQCGVVQVIQIFVPKQHQQLLLAELSAWHRHPLAAHMNCFIIETFDVEQLSCEHQGTRGRADCHLTGRKQNKGVREIIFVPSHYGIAFNDTQRVVLPVSASLELFAHEVAHWLGFADEYAMPQELAEAFCSGRYDHASLNVVVTEQTIMSESELIALWRRLPWRHAVESWQYLGSKQADGSWKLGSTTAHAASHHVGLFAAQTCEATSHYAWRPVNRFTPMQYFDVAEWPTVYLEMLQRAN